MSSDDDPNTAPLKRIRSARPPRAGALLMPEDTRMLPTQGVYVTARRPEPPRPVGRLS